MSGNLFADLGILCQVWESVIESGNSSSLGFGCQVLELVIKSGYWLLSLEIGSQVWK